MTSGRNTPAQKVLDAARESILSVGWKRATLTDVARRAGVSRMTLYRSYGDVRSLFGDLMTREWATSLAAVAAVSADDPLDAIAERMTTAIRRVREDELFRRILDVDPELLLPYLVERRGRTQELVLEALEQAIRDGQKSGAVRAGYPPALARALLLAVHGFVLSNHTMTDSTVTQAQLDDELAEMVRRYLAR